jgi:5-bromo-4-chloroindolyl phosphate hydrolysis protein
MKIILLSVFLFFSSFTCTDSNTVYICNSSGATKYHYTTTCRGLKNCQYKIIKTTLEAARSKGRTLCAWEQQ